MAAGPHRLCADSGILAYLYTHFVYYDPHINMAVSEFGLVIVKTIRQRSGLRTTPRYAAALLQLKSVIWIFHGNLILTKYWGYQDILVASNILDTITGE